MPPPLPRRNAELEDRSSEPTVPARDPLDGGVTPLAERPASQSNPATDEVLDPTIDDQVGGVLRDGPPPGSSTSMGWNSRKNAQGDPWAHRRGEPRLFAVFWMLYVIVSVWGSVEWVRRATSFSPDAYSPAARIMLAVVAVGGLVLWPMTRLCQATPKGPGGVPASVLADVIVVIAPIWMVVWPMVFMAGWPLDIVAAIAVMLAAWVYLVGGLLVLALSGHRALAATSADLRARSIWMMVILASVTAGTGLWGLLEARTMMGAEQAPSWMAMFSPFSAIPALTGHGFTGPETPVGRGQWTVILGTCGAGVICWILRVFGR